MINKENDSTNMEMENCTESSEAVTAPVCEKKTDGIDDVGDL